MPEQTYDYLIAPKASFDATADAIRAKTGSQDSITWGQNGFADAIDDLVGGGDVWEELLSYQLILNLKDDTSFDSKTPSTTAQEIYAVVNGVKEDDVMIETDAVDFTTYSYLGLGIQIIDFAYSSEPSNANAPKRNISVNRTSPNLFLRDVYEQWGVSKVGYIKKSNGSYQANNTYGIPASGCAFGTNSTSTATPKFRLQIAKINVQANTSNFPVEDIQKIDSKNSYITYLWKLYRAPRTAIDATQHNLVRSMIYAV